MKKTEILNLLYELASPVAMILAGLVLLVWPDAASVLISRLLGWGIMLVGIGFGIGAIVNRRKAVSRGVTAVGLACIGGVLSANPLLLAAFAGKIIGVLVLLRGLRELMLARTRGHGTVMAAVIAVAGLVLTLLPLTASRLLFSVCGLVLLAAGALLLAEKLRCRRLPTERPEVIDAE